jgi:hypothetical protein
MEVSLGGPFRLLTSEGLCVHRQRIGAVLAGGLWTVLVTVSRISLSFMYFTQLGIDRLLHCTTTRVLSRELTAHS